MTRVAANFRCCISLLRKWWKCKLIWRVQEIVVRQRNSKPPLLLVLLRIKMLESIRRGLSKIILHAQWPRHGEAFQVQWRILATEIVAYVTATPLYITVLTSSHIFNVYRIPPRGKFLYNGVVSWNLRTSVKRKFFFINFTPESSRLKKVLVLS